MRLLRPLLFAFACIACTVVNTVLATPARDNGRVDIIGTPPSHPTKKVFPARSVGWYWVYEGVAQAQTFLATGTRLEQIRIRAARLSGSRPNGSLHVEVRDLSLRFIYAQGVIRPENLQREFLWLPTELSYRDRLVPGRTYVLLLQSVQSSHTAPWAINAGYQDIYPDGRHLGYRDDLFFAVDFELDGFRVGPSPTCYFDCPVGAGVHARPVERRPWLVGAHPRVNEAKDDPLGPLPPGIRIGTH